ncbi:MAG: cytidylate kinase-like family protein [Bacteroidales bacterium]|nr:cytidylate kinase-like family protein [Bacteroidales bacterium]
MKSDNYIICIGRQLGSGGREVAKKISERLNIAYYDKEIISEASLHSGLNKSCFENVDEKPSSFLNCFGMEYGFPFYPISGAMENSCLSRDNLFQIQCDTITMLSQKGSAVFVGRAADYILRDHPRMLSVFLTANISDRIERVSKLAQVDHAKAKQMISECDKKRSEFYNYYTFREWGNAAGYDMCLNTSVLSINQVVDDIIKVVVEKFF